MGRPATTCRPSHHRRNVGAVRIHETGHRAITVRWDRRWDALVSDARRRPRRRGAGSWIHVAVRLDAGDLPHWSRKFIPRPGVHASRRAAPGQARFFRSSTAAVAGAAALRGLKDLAFRCGLTAGGLLALDSLAMDWPSAPKRRAPRLWIGLIAGLVLACGC